MSISFSFESDMPELVKLFDEIGDRAVKAEAAKALNRTVTFVRGEVSDEVATRTGIRKSLIRRRIKAIPRSRAKASRLTAKGFVGEEGIAVRHLRPKPRKAGRGAIYKTVTGQPVKSNAFFARGIRGRNGSRNSAFVRLTRERQSLREVQIRISPFLRRSTRRVLRTPAETFFNSTFHNNMDMRIEKEARKRGLTV